MKLHLPKILLTAVLLACSTVYAATSGPDVISINFKGNQGNTITVAGTSSTLGNIAASGWQEIDCSAGTYDVTNQEKTIVASLVLGGDHIGSWISKAAPPSENRTVTDVVQYGYIDVRNHGGENHYTISVDHDYWVTDTIFYMSGDSVSDANTTKSFAPMVVNGTAYIGGKNVEATDSNKEWGIGYTAGCTEFNSNNSITVETYGDLNATNMWVSNDSRATLAGMQIVDRTAETVYFTTLEEGTTNAADATWELNGVATGYGEITAAGKYLGVYASESGSTLNLPSGDKLVFLGVGSNELTVTAGGVASIDNLHTHTEDSILNLNATLTANQNLKITGEGLVNINTEQSLGSLTNVGTLHINANLDLGSLTNVGTLHINANLDLDTLTNTGALHIGDNVTIVLSGSFTNSGTLTAGEGASLFTLVEADTAVSIGNSTITANQELLIDHLQDSNIMLNAAETNMGISTTGGTLSFAKGTEAPDKISVAITNMNWTSGALSMNAGTGVTVSAGEVNLTNSLTLTGSFEFVKISSGEGTDGTTLTVNSGSTLKVGSVLLSWPRHFDIDGIMEVTGAEGTTFSTGESPNISGDGTLKTTKLVSRNHASLDISINRLEIGAGGFNTEASGSINMGATTIAATESWSKAVTTAFTLSDNSTGTTFEVAANAAIELQGVISNKEGATGMLVKTGDGKLTLSGANTYTGGTKINAGQVVAGNDAAFGTGTVHLIGGSVEILEDRTIATAFDMGGQGSVYAGKLNVAAGKHLTMTNNLWIGPNASINLASEAKLTKGDMTISGTGADSSITRHADKDGNTFSAGSSSHIVSNAKVEVASASESTLALQLTNSSVTNTGEGKLIVNNAANTLTAVNAEGGNITVQNASESEVTIGSISATGGHTVTAEIGALKVNTVSLGAGLSSENYALTTTGTLTLGSLELNLTDYTTGEYKLISSTGLTWTEGNYTTTGLADGLTAQVGFAEGSSSNLVLTIGTASSPEPQPSSWSLSGEVTYDAALNMLTLNLEQDLTSYDFTEDGAIIIPGISDSVMKTILGLTDLPEDGMVGIQLMGADDVAFAAAADQMIGFQGKDGVYWGTNVGSNWQYYVQYIPEPATATLSLLALAGLAARRRRK